MDHQCRYAAVQETSDATLIKKAMYTQPLPRVYTLINTYYASNAVPTRRVRLGCCNLDIMMQENFDIGETQRRDGTERRDGLGIRDAESILSFDVGL